MPARYRGRSSYPRQHEEEQPPNEFYQSDEYAEQDYDRFDQPGQYPQGAPQGQRQHESWHREQPDYSPQQSYQHGQQRRSQEWSGRGQQARQGPGPYSSTQFDRQGNRWQDRGFAQSRQHDLNQWQSYTDSEFGSQPYGPQGSQYGSSRFQGSMSSSRQGQRRYSGTSPKGYTRSDDRIKEDICDRLTDCDLDCSEIEVSVADGQVTLSGTVDAREDKFECESIADSVSGVQDVVNQLRLKRQQSSEFSMNQQAEKSSERRTKAGSR